MRTGLSQHTSLRQELRVNPRLYQAMDMLYMPMMDLQQHLKQELLSNPFLELLEPEEETPEQKDSEQEKEQKEKSFWLRERLENTFERRFELPPETDTENVSATFAKGVLAVHVPKTGKPAARKVPIGT